VRRLVLAGLALLLGCAYYNAMYNAKRLAGSARKAEREGRTLEANQFWNLVAVKAESVLVRHPRSKWTDEARYLRGVALARLRDCERAVGPLEQVMTGSGNRRLAEAAAFELGDCRLVLGDSRGAMVAFGRLLTSDDRRLRERALYEHGRALRATGQYELALAELSRTPDRRARGERAAALAGLGRLTEAEPLADSLIAEGDTLAPWSAILAGAAGYDPDRAAALLDRVVAIPHTSPAFRSTLLLEDGVRLLGRDPARAEARLTQAEEIGEGLPSGGLARLTRIRAALARAETTEDLARHEGPLEELAEFRGAHGPAAALLAGLVRRTRAAADSALPGTPLADLRTFVAAEMARDSVGAPRLASRLFRRLVAQWPDSPYAPKALLALIALDSAGADTLRLRLTEQYATSPYLAVIEGRESPAYQALEDSLRRFVLSFRPEGRGAARPAASPAGAPPRRPLE
jgi:tetratricopeptide (TPR) repeat protein